MLIRNSKADSSNPDQLEGDFYFPLFQRNVAVWGFSQDSISYANECVKLAVNLSETLISELCQSSIRYCNTFLEEIGEDVMYFDDEKAILSLINPRALIIEDGASIPVIHMELDCEWEEEHGMEWIIRDGKLQYVGAFNGEDPFGDFTEKEEWNFA